MASAAKGAETCARKVPLAGQMTSVSDSECPPLGLYVGRVQQAYACTEVRDDTKELLPFVFVCYCMFTATFMYL